MQVLVVLCHLSYILIEISVLLITDLIVDELPSFLIKQVTNAHMASCVGFFFLKQMYMLIAFDIFRAHMYCQILAYEQHSMDK